MERLNLPPVRPLSGRVALVTGGSRGIGAEIVQALARAGADVAFTYKSSVDLARDVASRARASGVHAVALPASEGQRSDSIKALAEISEALGPVDILVNNAAIAQEKPFSEISDDDWDLVLGVNLRGPFIWCQETAPGMAERGWGRVVNIASVGGQWGGARQPHYAAAKAGLISLTRSLARLYSNSGVTANAVSPGLVRTDMTATEIDSAAGREKIAAIPIGRTGTVREVADAVVFLASDASSYITGQTLGVNGGMYFG